MSSKSNDQGRAYEYICLLSLQNAISAIRKSQIIHNSSYEAAEHAWNTLSVAEKALYTLSAKSTIDTIFALEPNIIEVDDDTLNLYIQSDEHGEEADLYMDFKPKSKTTVIMSFDNGWQFSFRIHNAKDTVEPSLKFDVQIVGMPPAVNITFNCKW